MSRTWNRRRQLAAKLAGVPIDVLINNAGVYNDRAKCAGDDAGCPGDYGGESFGKFNYSLLDTIMAVNIKGPLIVSESFLQECPGEQPEENHRRQLQQRHADR